MKLENLATVMTLYSRRTFSKESFQWTKCVVKYLYDAYSHLSHNMLAFLVEVSKMYFQTILTFRYISLGIVVRSFIVIQFSTPYFLYEFIIYSLDSRKNNEEVFKLYRSKYYWLSNCWYYFTSYCIIYISEQLGLNKKK